MLTQWKLHYEDSSKGKDQQPHILPSSSNSQLMSRGNEAAQMHHFLHRLNEEVKDELAHVESPTHMDAVMGSPSVQPENFVNAVLSSLSSLSCPS